MKYKFNTYEILYAIMLVTNTAVVRFLEINYCTYVLLAYLVIMRLGKKITNDEFLLLSLLFPISIFNCFRFQFILLFKSSNAEGKFENYRKDVLGFAFVIGIANCAIYSNIPLGTFFFSSCCVLLYI